MFKVLEDVGYGGLIGIEGYKKGYMVKIRHISNEKRVFYWKYVLGGDSTKILWEVFINI
jgi:hypothetical protein